MKKVLVVSHYFPPVGGAGVQRAAKFVKYLPQFGWKPIVLTAENPSVPVFDESLLRDIPEETVIVRTKTLEPSYAVKESLGKRPASDSSLKQKVSSAFRSLVKSLLLPDPQVLWWPNAAWKMFRLLKEEKVDLVFATAPPFSVLVLATVVGRLRKIPVVVDFRDEWVFARNHLENAQRGRFAQWVDHFLEGYVVSKCSGFVAATQSYVDGIYHRHPKVFRDKGLAITNGYDEDDFTTIVKIPSEGEKKKINILYTGTVWKATSLKPFLLALKQALIIAPSLNHKMVFTLIGRVVGEEKEILDDPIFLNIINIMGYRKHRETIQEMFDADVLLLTLSDIPGSEKIIPGKTFEYMATGKPILAITPQGETVNILDKNYKCSTVFDPRDIELIKNFIINLSIGGNSPDFRRISGPSQFTRYSLAQKLTKFFSKMEK